MSNGQTKEIIASMLREPTGRALCDSGGTPKYDENGKYIGSTGGYGRAYERNAGMTVEDWDATPEATLDASYGELGVTISLYHCLVNRLDYEPELDRLFAAWAGAREDTYYLDDMRAFPAALARWARFEDEVPDWAEIAANHWENYDGKPEGAAWNWDEGPALAAHEELLQLALGKVWSAVCADDPPEPVDVLDGIYGENHRPTIIYTYNEENALSQDIQFALFGLDTGGAAGGPFVLLQVHGGCDARGGFTKPRLFSFNGQHDSDSFFNWGRVSVQDSSGAEDAPYWDSENGGYSFSASIKVGENEWTTLHIDPGKTTVIRDVPASIAPTVARVVAAWWRNDEAALIPTEVHPDLFGGESPMVVGEISPDVRAAIDYLDAVEDYDQGELALVTDEDGNAYCPVTGGKLEAWAW